MTARASRNNPPAPNGEIRFDATYTLDEFRRRLGVSGKGVATMRRSGLAVRYCGRKGFVHGRDFGTFVESLDTARGRGGQA